MTVKELCERMDSQELTEWIAYTTYFEALPDSWRETALITTALIAPHSPSGKAPKVNDFVPIEHPPQDESETMSVLFELQQALGQG